MIKAGEELLRLQAENIRLKEGIKQAIQEMDDLANHKVRPISFDQAVAIDMCIDIVKKLIEG